MPMFSPSRPVPPPMPPEAYDLGAGGYNASPQIAGTPPALPDPSLAAAPPTSNATGGPGAAQADLRSGVFTQLYRLGKRMSGKDNMFGGFDPNAPAAPVDPLANLLPEEAPAPTGPVLPPLPPSPQAPTPDQYPLHLRPPAPQTSRPIDRFPGLAARMGRPGMPDERMRGQR